MSYVWEKWRTKQVYFKLIGWFLSNEIRTRKVLIKCYFLPYTQKHSRSFYMFATKLIFAFNIISKTQKSPQNLM